MYQLLYVSQEARKMEKQDLLDILAVARKKNQPAGVTGILLYKGGRFVQVLEGDEEAVKDIYVSIKEDDRHKNIVTVLEGKIDEREFGNWEMGFIDLEDIPEESLEGISRFLEGEYSAKDLIEQQTKVQAFLKLFKNLA